jgi:cbb3-type cytochrome oxidase cytochrome c subunit
LRNSVGLIAAFLALPLGTVATAMLMPRSRTTGATLGREVYVAEGCIHCHSQFVRPGTTDVEWSGDARNPDWSRAQAPALIGNRRQGPDLMNVGLRLPREWHRLHLVDPRSVAPASRMPSYAHLFAPGDPRGEALIDYLLSLGREGAGISTKPADSPIALPAVESTIRNGQRP